MSIAPDSCSPGMGCTSSSQVMPHNDVAPGPRYMSQSYKDFKHTAPESSPTVDNASIFPEPATHLTHNDRPFYVARSGEMVYPDEQPSSQTTDNPNIIPGRSQARARTISYSMASVSHKQREIEVSRERKWLQMLQNWDKVKHDTTLIRRRVRKGIPESMRGIFWYRFSGAGDLQAAGDEKHRAEHKDSYETWLAQGKAGSAPVSAVGDVVAGIQMAAVAANATNAAPATAAATHSNSISIPATRIDSNSNPQSDKDIVDAPSPSPSLSRVPTTRASLSLSRSAAPSPSHATGNPNHAPPATAAAAATAATQALPHDDLMSIFPPVDPHPPHPYQQSLFQYLSSQHSPKDSLIAKDVPRTFPSHVLFSATAAGSHTLNPRGRRSLALVCRAYSLYDPDLGYCQGLSFVAAALLLYMPAEEAFWTLAAMLTDPRYALRSLYTPGFRKLEEMQYVVAELMMSLDRKLSKHITDCHFHYSMVLPQWIMCLFVYTLPLPAAMRLWDVMFFEGTKVLVRAAIYMLRYHRKELLKGENDEILMIMCQRLGKDCPAYADVDKFMEGVLDVKITTKQVEKLTKQFDEQKHAATVANLSNPKR